jgi:hypothetical protein
VDVVVVVVVVVVVGVVVVGVVVVGVVVVVVVVVGVVVVDVVSVVEEDTAGEVGRLSDWDRLVVEDALNVLTDELLRGLHPLRADEAPRSCSVTINTAAIRIVNEKFLSGDVVRKLVKCLGVLVVSKCLWVLRNVCKLSIV